MLLACQVALLELKGAHTVISLGAKHFSALHHILPRLLSTVLTGANVQRGRRGKSAKLHFQLILIN